MADLQMYADHFLMEMIDEAILGVVYEVRSMPDTKIYKFCFLCWLAA